MAGVHLGGPLRLAGALGVGRHVVSGIDGYSSAYALVETGLGGTKLVTGIAAGTVAVFSSGRVALLRTWSGARIVGPNQTYAGAEGRFSVALVTLGIGQYWRVAGATAGDDRFVAGTVGLWF